MGTSSSRGGRHAAGSRSRLALDRPAPSRGATLWHNANFLTFWLGEGISLFGQQVTVLALPLTAVLTLHAGPEQLGLIRFLQYIPYLLFGLPFGVLVDRSRRRPIMIGANVLRLSLIALVPILATLGSLDATILFGITFGIGMAAVLYDVSWMSYVPTLVQGDRQLLVEANSKLGATSSAADMAGPSIGGVLVAAFTAPIAMAVNAGSYVVSIVTLLLIRLPESVPERTKRRLITELTDGLRFVAGNRYLRVAAAVGGATNFFVSATVSMFLLYAVRDRGIGAGLLGVILSAAGAGGVLGAISASRLIRRFRIGTTYRIALSAAFIAPVLIPAASGPRLVLVALYAVAFAVTDWGMGAANVLVLSLRQAITPQAFMGRMNAAMRTFMFGLAAFGGPFGGILAALLGLHTALWISAIGSVLILIPLLISPVGRLREMPPVAELPGSTDLDAVPT